MPRKVISDSHGPICNHIHACLTWLASIQCPLWTGYLMTLSCIKLIF
uniref:Uncharacterized protein n=1 Tax=Anguilla anguilla TaxID=7936 RepID=A0A0E9QEM9_ANGAN